MTVKITINYNGKYMEKAGMQSEELVVSDRIGEAYPSIMEYMKQNHGIDPPFLLMVRGMHVMGAVKKDIRLMDGDTFQILPFLSGG